jgi:hypothetical protein
VARRLYILLCLTLTLGGICACEKLAGIEKKELLPESDAGSKSCGIVSPSGIGLRVAHMVPVQQKLDICISLTGGQFSQLPMLAAGGSGCPSGIGYSQYTVPLILPAGTYDVKLVPQGSDCSADGPKTSGISISDTASTSVIAYGPDLARANLVHLEDADKSGPDISVRFFHALNGEGTLEAGLADATPPATIIRKIFSDIAFGNISQPSPSGTGTFPVDVRGYMDYGTSSDVGGLQMGASRAESALSAITSSFISLKKSHHYTLFLMGIRDQLLIDTSGQPTYPPKLWSCDELSGEGLFAVCGDPSPISASIFHPNLTDAFTGYIDVREKGALDAIEKATLDVLCLPELYSPEVQQNLKDRISNMPGVTAYFSDDPTIVPAGDLTDASGVSPIYPDIACDGNYKTLISSFETCLLGLDCVGSSTPDAGQDYFGVAGSLAIGCAAQGCLASVNDFVSAQSHDADACFMCAIAHLSSYESIENMYAKCTSSTGRKPHYVFNGSTGLALLTRLNLPAGQQPEVVLLPSSTWNRAALRVPLELPNKSVIDVWCADVRGPNPEPFLLNGGPYYGDAKGGDSAGGNTAEERLQIQRLIATINSHAQNDQRRAIVATLTYTSPQIKDSQDHELVTALVPENFKLFQDQPAWAELVAASYTPACTFCGDNPLNSITDNQWTHHLFGVGIGADTVTDTQRTFTTKSLSVLLYDTSNGNQTSVPVSQYYGIQSTVRISQ